MLDPKAGSGRFRQILIPASLLLAILLVIANTALSFRSLRVLNKSQGWVDHTWEVIDQIGHITNSARDAESGIRGYLITHDNAYLEPYTVALAELPQELDQFQSLTRDNESQQVRAADLRAAIHERLVLLDESRQMLEANQADSLHALVVSGTGKAQMERIRRIARACEDEERRLLIVREQEVRDNLRHTRQIRIASTAMDLLFIVLMFWYFARERRLRLISEETAAALALSRQQIEQNALEITALNVTLEERVRQRTAELENTNRELEAFSYSVSHDLRAPLRTIDGFSLALEEDYQEAVDAVGRDYIKRVRSGVQRMGQLIDALLQLSRVTRADITREAVNLSAMAESVVANLLEENPGRAIEITVEPGMKVNADPKLLRVALENLLGNAVKFTGKLPEAVIHFGWDPGLQAYFVKDNGAGFDMHYAPKLFNAFNRLHGDKDFKGSGIGLATVARVIGRHHGRIWADSVVDHGATFFFTVGLPHEG